MDPSNATYFIGHETIVPREDGKGLPRIVRSTFWFLLRNSNDASDYFRLPRDMVVEIGPSICYLITIRFRFWLSGSMGSLACNNSSPGQGELTC